MTNEEASVPRPHMEKLGFSRGDMRVHCPGHYFYCYSKQVGDHKIELDHDFCEGVLHLHVDDKPRFKFPESRLDQVDYMATLMEDWSWYVGLWMSKAEFAARQKAALLPVISPPKRKWWEAWA